VFFLHTPGGVMLVGPGYAKGLSGEEFTQLKTVGGIPHVYAAGNQRAVDVILAATQQGGTTAGAQGRARPQVRLIECKDALWFTDFVHVVHAPNPEVVQHYQNMGWLDNDRDHAGNVIAQGVPDAAFDTLVQA